MKKRLITLTLAAVLALTAIGCGRNDDGITVISREDGSGTRGAFVELLGIEQKNADGQKEDMTIQSAEITNSTAVMLSTITGNKNAIGYVSLGSLNDTVKALEVDGVQPSVENVKNGSYKVARPFLIVTSGEKDALMKDFIGYILSAEGQAIVEQSGYIGNGSTEAYKKNEVNGKIVVGGSSSVTPVMEKLKEAYLKVQPQVVIEIQLSDSTTGINGVKEGILNIGMSSRELKQSELSSNLDATTIATDGIAVIVNHECAFDGLTSEQIKNIYIGAVTTWSELNQ